MRRRRTDVVAVLGLLVLVAGCADPVPKAEATIELSEYALELEPARADEGAVKFFVDNVGEQEHGLVFARAKDRESLPLAPDGSVDLTKAQIADRLEPVGPGRYRIQPDLFPGPLVVFCNLVTPGPDGQPVSHFQQGMWAELEIESTTSATIPPPPG